MKRPTKSMTETPQAATELRIIGGHFRGSKLRYHGDPQTRPMKDRVREAIFNLVTTDAEGCHAIDLFAGTGALGLEAISRGAVSATFIEKHVPSARVVADNIAALGLKERTTLLTTSAFLWSKRDLPTKAVGLRIPEVEEKDDFAIRDPQLAIPWLVFCSPPYTFYVDRRDAMCELVASIMQHAPPGSIVIAEADDRFDFDFLPGGVQKEKHGPGWDVRTYPPAVVGVWRGKQI
ncbi:MAG: RsmD family RNA methyltransferase [Pirellulales bacterium]|nr:RsmD family RNA methyltransferase [Pirellulales bacterium]